MADHDDELDDELDDEMPADLDREPAEDDENVLLDAYDLDHDGKVSIIEDVRARLGVVDANLEEHAKQPGVKGTIADAAHRALDKLDND